MEMRKKLLLSIASGLLLFLSFPPMPTFFLAFFAFIPLLFLLDSEKKLNPLYLYICFFIYHTATLWWISSFQEKTDPFLMISGFVLDIVHPLFFFIPIMLWLFIRIGDKSSGSLYSFPFCWVFFEWLHAQTELSFPWLTVGYTQATNIYWVQFADITGVYGVSFTICLVNVLLYDILRAYTKGEFRYIRFRYQIATLLLLIIIPVIYSNISNVEYKHEILMKNNEKVKIGMVQPNINPWEKWDKGNYDQIIYHKRLSDSLISIENDIDLIVWNETQILYLNENFNTLHNFGFLRDWVDSSRISLLSGFVDLVYYESKEKAPSIAKSTEFNGKDTYFDTFNSALLLNPNQEGSQIYHKMKLTPFGERIPHVELISFMQDFVLWGVGISFWGKGTEQKVLTVNNNDKSFKVASIICIESIYPGFVRQFANLDAEIFTLITNDAWYDGTPGPAQHNYIAVMRAIENKRYIARCANSGVTNFISANGRILRGIPQYQYGVTAMEMPLISKKTIYSKYGNWFVYVTFFLLLFYLLRIIFKSRK